MAKIKSPYMAAAEAMGKFQTDVYSSMEYLDEGETAMKRIEERNERHQALFKLASEGLSTIEKITADKQETVQADKTADKYGEALGKDVLVEKRKVRFRDIVGNKDLTLADIGTRHYDFIQGGSTIETHAREDMLALQEQTDIPKYEGMMDKMFPFDPLKDDNFKKRASEAQAADKKTFWYNKEEYNVEDWDDAGWWNVQEAIE